MKLEPHVEAFQRDLAAIAAIGGEAVSAAAERLAAAIRTSAGLRLLDVVSEAAQELSGQLPSGHVEVRLAGQDPSLVYVEAADDEARGAKSDELSARITLRLPEALKASVEAAAAREGISLNTWIVRALSRAVSTPARRSGNRLTGFAQG